MADQSVYILRALISLYNFKPLFGLSSSPTNLRFNLYVWFLMHHVVLVATSCYSKSRGPHLPVALVLEPSCVAWKHFGRPPTARGNTSTVLFPWTPCHCIYRMDPQNDSWKIWISMCFDFTIFGFQNSWAKPRLYPPWVPRWDAPRSAAATVASSVPWSDISDVVVAGWQSGLKDWISSSNWNPARTDSFRSFATWTMVLVFTKELVLPKVSVKSDLVLTWGRVPQHPHLK